MSIIYITNRSNLFLNGNIYSVNSLSCGVIDKIISHIPLDAQETEYSDLLVKNNLLDLNYNYSEYMPDTEDFELSTCWLEITQGCNCRCVHCYEGTVHKKSDVVLSLKEWHKTIDQLLESGFKRFVVIGGEPCVSENVEDILRYVSEKGGDTTLFTNGTLISLALKDIIVSHKIRVKFSIYGHNSSVHDGITQHVGSFKLLTDNIQFFINNHIDVSASVILMKENEKYYQQICNYLDSLGINYKCDVIREVFGGCQSQHIPENTDLIRSFCRTSPQFPKIDKKKFDLAVKYNTCWFGKIVVCEDGAVLPCVFERNNILGNVKKQSIAEILNSPEIKYCWEFNINKVDNCKECEFRFGCKDCRPLASACGSIEAQNPRCTYNAFRGKWI